MKVTRWISTSLVVAVLSWATGCASIISGRHADVTFHSNVPNASVIVHNKHGEQVTVSQTESKVSLKRKDGLITPAHYTATITAPGYEPASVEVNSTVNPWVLGNVVVGGVIGIAVDSATGAVWKPRQSSYYQPLTPIAGPSMYGALPPTQLQPGTQLVNANTPVSAAASPTSSVPVFADPTVQTAGVTNAPASTPIYR